jgi:oligopeptide transport system substrate-binding protein
MIIKQQIFFIFCILLVSCSDSSWNNPYPATQNQGIHYSSFSEQPKTLDPARSYSANEYQFIGQIYEPVLQYHYLKRPYQLVPLTASQFPKAQYYDANNNLLADETATKDVDHTIYTIHIKPGIYYQPHPAFAKDDSGRPRYLNLHDAQLTNIHQLEDFPHTGTQELIAEDYVYQIKRLAQPNVHSPILSIMVEYIEGLAKLSETLQGATEKLLDLRKYDLPGAKVIGRYQYQITIKGKYPQFLFWLAMPFFSPVPAIADLFYQQPGMQEKNLTLAWYPVGTGPYYLSKNDPNRQVILSANPNFHGEKAPDSDADLPFIEKAIYLLEKETIPYWNKFLQGYYDASKISSDNFDQAVQVGSSGEAALTAEMQEKGIQLKTAVQTSIQYMGFNMLDPVIGGYSMEKQKLRQAISIAIDYEEYISIFNNGRGVAAQSPVPPGIFGYLPGQPGINPFVYDWQSQTATRKSLSLAKKLLAQAGFVNGIDQKTDKPLVLYLDTTGTGPENKARLDWYRKQFRKLNIQLDIRATDYNRFQEKMRKGHAQIFQWGWNADYPDPENFLFLLYGPNAKVQHQGENAANYNNPKFNRLFEQMKNMGNNPKRQEIINKMLSLLQKDAPWLWGFHPEAYTLHHHWYENFQPNLMANNTLKYIKINPDIRARKQQEWNQPIIWPLIFVGIFVLAFLLPAFAIYRRKENRLG